LDMPSVAFDQAVFQTSQPDVAATLTGFGESSQGDILYYRVDFGDGSDVETVTPDSSGALVVNHKYPARGAYKAHVEVVDEYGHKAVNTAFVNVGYVLFMPWIGR